MGGEGENKKMGGEKGKMDKKWTNILIASVLVLSTFAISLTIATETNPPSVINPSASPSVIANDGSEYTELTVEVIDDTAVDTVTVDLTPIGGEVVYMTCKGNYTENGKVICVFNYITNATCPPGTYNLIVNATDATENRNYNNTEFISLVVTGPTIGPTASIKPKTQEVMAGENFSVGIYFDPAGDGFVGGSIILKFNASVIQVNAVNPGDLLGEEYYEAPTNEIDNTNGTVRYEAVRLGGISPPAPAGNFTVISASVREDAPSGTYYLNITKAEFADENGDPIPGIAVENGTITVKKYPRWDVDEDGDVDFWDLAKVAAHYGEKTEPPYPRWDVDEDGDVDFWDLAKVAAHYGEKYE